MDNETFNQLLKQQQVTGVFRASSKCAIELVAKIVGNVNLNLSTILAKRFILVAWLSPECTSAGGYSTDLKN